MLTIKLTADTRIQKMDQGSLTDIQPGERITVQGSRGSDGSFAAQSIQIGAGGFGGAPGAGGNGAPPAGGAAGGRTPQQTPAAGTANN